MFRRASARKKDYLSPSVGWLFADLLLALSVLFMISYVLPPPPVTATSTPTPTPTPTRPPNSLVLDRNVLELSLMVNDPEGLSHGDPTAKSQLAGLVRKNITDRHLQNRRAGIVLSYGGAPSSSDTDIARAFNIDRNVYDVLASLGRQKFVFCGSVVYYYSDPQNTQALYNLGTNSNMVKIDIFLFNDYFSGC